MKRPFSFAELGKLVQGDANEVKEGEILVITSTEFPGMIEDIQKRVNGVLKSLIVKKPVVTAPEETE